MYTLSVYKKIHLLNLKPLVRENLIALWHDKDIVELVNELATAVTSEYWLGEQVKVGEGLLVPE
jgi:hypothetical protein